MAALIAIGHIVGALVALLTFGLVVLALAAWETERNRKTVLQEMSLALGLPVDEIDNRENQERVIQFAAARFSSEYHHNQKTEQRKNDQTKWGWFGSGVQVCVILGVIWY